VRGGASERLSPAISRTASSASGTKAQSDPSQAKAAPEMSAAPSAAKPLTTARGVNVRRPLRRPSRKAKARLMGGLRRRTDNNVRTHRKLRPSAPKDADVSRD